MSAKCHVCGFTNDSASVTCDECGVAINSSLQFVVDEDFNEAIGEPVESSSESEDKDNPAEPSKESGEMSSDSSDASDENSKKSEPASENDPVIEQGLTVVPQSLPEKVEEKQATGSSDSSRHTESVSSGVCPSCMADVDEADFYCSICGANIRHYVSEEDLRISPPVPPEPGGTVIFKLVVVTGHDKGSVHSFSRNEALLGRALDNDIVLASDGYTSGRHSRVFEEDGQFFVEDLGSTNGTFVRVMGRVRIKVGDEIKVGQSIFRFEDVLE